MICQRNLNLFFGSKQSRSGNFNMVKLDWHNDIGLKWTGSFGSCFIFSKSNFYNKKGIFSFYGDLNNFILIQKLKKGLQIWTRGFSKKGKLLLLGFFFWNYSNLLKSFLSKNVLGLKLYGVGYKIFVKKKFIILELGFTHRVYIHIPAGISAVSPAGSKNQNLYLIGFCKNAVYGFGAFLRNLKKPDVYKGKGIRFLYEVVKLKKGKKKE